MPIQEVFKIRAIYPAGPERPEDRVVAEWNSVQVPALHELIVADRIYEVEYILWETSGETMSRVTLLVSPSANRLLRFVRPTTGESPLPGTERTRRAPRKKKEPSSEPSSG